jgi:hypothetical protein
MVSLCSCEGRKLVFIENTHFRHESTARKENAESRGGKLGSSAESELRGQERPGSGVSWGLSSTGTKENTLI